MVQAAAAVASKALFSREKMVGVARIELATPAMSTPAASANLLILLLSRRCGSPISPTKMAFQQPFEFTLN
jgi:hypothetical protein